MKQFNRRNFLKQMLLGSGALFLPPLVSKATSAATPSAIDKTQYLREAKEAFYRRQYAKAEMLYRQIIAQYPNEIAAYDGLAKVCNAQQKSQEITLLYRSALETQPQNPLLYDRLARSLVALQLGNYRQMQAYCQSTGETFPIQTAAALYIQALALAPDKKYLSEGLLDTVRALETKNRQLQRLKLPEIRFSDDINNQITTLTAASCENWEQSRKREKHRGRVTAHLEDSLEKIHTKKRRTLYSKADRDMRESSIKNQQKIFLYPYLSSALKEKNTAAAEIYYNRIKSLNPQQPEVYARFLLGKHYKKQGKFKQLAAFWESEKTDLPYWQSLRKARALVLDGEQTGNSKSFEQARQIYQSIREEIEAEEHDTMALAALYSGMSRCFRQQKRWAESRSQLQAGLNRIAPASGIAASLLIDYAESFDNEKTGNKSERLLQRLSGEKKSQKFNDDAFIENYLQKREKDLENRKQSTHDASYALAKLYEKKGNKNRLNEVLDFIGKRDTKNEFVRKRRHNHS
ncbi:hypothetical protein FACS189413_12770 [Bacteroidia bacterium]|nr:hypothetical protein FACS189463_2320 [Bacteroidia bacterium]GHU71270.1 hypothetical protein FACS189413_12770 [Bacteroidia bacterium]